MGLPTIGIWVQILLLYNWKAIGISEIASSYAQGSTLLVEHKHKAIKDIVKLMKGHKKIEPVGTY